MPKTFAILEFLRRARPTLEVAATQHPQAVIRLSLCGGVLVPSLQIGESIQSSEQFHNAELGGVAECPEGQWCQRFTWTHSATYQVPCMAWVGSVGDAWSVASYSHNSTTAYQASCLNARRSAPACPTRSHENKWVGSE